MGKIYRWKDEAAIEYFKENFGSQSRNWEDHVGFGNFEVTKEDHSGNILGICTSTRNFEASSGLFEMYWCLFLAQDIEKLFVDITCGEPEVPSPPKSEDFFVLTKSPKPSERSSVHGPYTRKEADEFAISQIRGGIDGVKVLVTQVVGEAKAIYKVE